MRDGGEGGGDGQGGIACRAGSETTWLTAVFDRGVEGYGG